LELCFGNLLEILDKNYNLFYYFKSSKVGLLSWFTNISYYLEDLNPYQFYMNPHRIRSFSVLVNSVIITYSNQPNDGLRPVCSGSCWCYAPDRAMVQSYSVEFLVAPFSPYPKHSAISDFALTSTSFCPGRSTLHTLILSFLVFFLTVFLTIIFPQYIFA